MAKVEIFYADLCGLCHKAMDYFRARGLPFEAYRVQWDAARDKWKDTETAREMQRRCGEDIDFVPQLFIDGKWISGWKSLEPMIDSGEIDAMLEPQDARG